MSQIVSGKIYSLETAIDTANDKRINEVMKKQNEKNQKEKKALKNKLLKLTDDVELIRDELSHKKKDICKKI